MTEKEIRIINGKEIVLYREIETDLYRFSKDAVDMLLQAFEEAEQYRVIGTVEEFKDLKEKSEPKKPLHVPTDDTCVTYEWRCPTCDEWISHIVKFHHCKCGQKLDWY